jgi:hypothetical protein
MSLPSISKFGGWRNVQTARYDLIPGEALEAVAEVFAEGETKYGRLGNDPYYPNWVELDLSSDQSPLSHALNHLAQVQLGAGLEEEDHLASAAANILIMLWFRDSDSSLVQGLTWPEVVRFYYKRRLEGAPEQEAAMDALVAEAQEAGEYYKGVESLIADDESDHEPNILERILAKVTG